MDVDELLREDILDTISDDEKSVESDEVDGDELRTEKVSGSTFDSFD